MTRIPLAVLPAILAAACAAGGSEAAVSGSWVGSFTLPVRAQPVAIAVDVHGAAATVALGPGHSSAAKVAVVAHGSRLRFSLPGLPANVVFSGSLRGARLTGKVSQGALRGTFRLRRGSSRVLSALGLYRSRDGATVAVIQAQGLPTWLVELPSGTTHGLNASLTRVGRLLGETSGDGTLAVDRKGLTWTHGDGTSVRYARLALRQKEVRVGAMAGTLSVPDGPGPRPGAVIVHGSDPETREEFQTFAAYLESVGVAVLAADKRGAGQSGGSSSARSSEDTIDLLARDSEAQVRFLARRPELAPSRIGLLGDSQAGWVIALAAAREHAVRWAVPLVGPTTTVGETDLFTALAGAGRTTPSGTRAQMLAQVREQGPSGFDPLPSLRSLAIPVFWVYGDDDRNVPTELSVERLESIRSGHDFSWVVLHMTHALIDLPNGLYSSLAQSRGFTADLFPAVGAWLRSRGVVN